MRGTEGQLTRSVTVARKEAERLQECVQRLESTLCQVPDADAAPVE